MYRVMKTQCLLWHLAVQFTN